MTTAQGGPNGRWLLAIDTSSEQASVALSDGGRFAEISWSAGRDQTATLLGEIDRLCALLRVAIADVAVVAIATGPGMFNGLRVGLSVAKGFVLGLDVPLIGISTLDVAAHPYLALEQPVLACVAAGRGRLVWAEYRDDRGRWRQTVPPRNGTASELASRAAVSAPCIVTGELSAEQVREIQAVAGVAVPASSVRLRRASVLAELARARFIAGDVDDVVELEPVYVHATARATP
jgi:tRNA threonylcarbamoyladenosine biosynthesis protein TsaB